MPLSYRSEKLPNGWYKRQDLHRYRSGRYCDKCEKRIAEEDIYYTKDEDPHRSLDLCEPCYTALSL